MSDFHPGWTVVGVTLLVALNNAVWALIIWRVNSRCQSQVRDAMKVVLTMAQTPAQFMQGVGPQIASQMEDTDRAQVEGENENNHAARRQAMRPAI